MYNTRPGLLIGFHGCDKVLQQQLLLDSTSIPISNNPFDWLGHGMYFWENNYDRALEWAIKKCDGGDRVSEPAVIGAVIDLAHCCDLLDDHFIRMVSLSYDLMATEYASIGRSLPVNKDAAGDPHSDKLIRFRDCATVEFMHKRFRNAIANQIISEGYTSLKPFDSVRSVFLEGGEAYPGAGISAKSHIQLCIRNPNCIKGFFLKRDGIDFLQHEVSRTGVKNFHDLRSR
ncbi:hypothetical protein LZZ85_05545 [Terrimonas sp. NA20]|uniref:DUF3990 domain-containing protein n=1 Tax=Terrimonas ginsenosidimutans TaxID=2908004 RepID=A0ABS9KN29_9BACT|nr:hypothetical protein [Terrimonas ginsenosidimutans]MCG2613731.1 hypothetical protein [Terrimonas ginsenosidimutans]